ncbi:agamous-like MADS-box protein AGL29 [Cynara cardunculus var. scolymus]|uniref:Transcription factor, MADS-box n=1 Tax=Cynara cardunculus var. scolymus TaxID=59895 RepID=A0A103SPX1_CYNCS|nr:agamous-like MADS-box protein AGL29 [Cynara cardunculus var. scolymus]KVG90338.1 Transcription factor, MADS-box [Cynara cardunculus var. scolymus]
MARLPSKDRKKIQLKRIENEKERAVTLSKRCNDIFKKANKLATLCHIQIAIILFSIIGKRLSFGSPNVQSVVNKFLNPNQLDQQPNDFINMAVNSNHESKLQDFNKEFDEVNEHLANEKKQGQMLDEYIKRLLGGKTYKEYVAIRGYYGFMQIKFKMEELQRNKECTLVAVCGPSSSNDENEAYLSKIGVPKDYLKQ